MDTDQSVGTRAVGETATQKSRRLIQLGFILMGLGAVIAAIGEPAIGSAGAFLGWTFLLPGLIGWAVNDSPSKARS